MGVVQILTSSEEGPMNAQRDDPLLVRKKFFNMLEYFHHQKSLVIFLLLDVHFLTATATAIF
jgi:hypothetical protein